MAQDKSVNNYRITLALVFLRGFVSGHRSYGAKVGTGILFLFTGGLFGYSLDGRDFVPTSLAISPTKPTAISTTLTPRL